MTLATSSLLPSLVGIVTLLVPAPQVEARGNPLYWLILGLPLPWVWKLMDYTPWALRGIRPVLWVAPFLAGFVATWAAIDRQDTEPYAWAIAVTVALSLVGGLCYDRSVLKHEGPGYA